MIVDEDRRRTAENHSRVNFAGIGHAAFDILEADETEGFMRRKRLRASIDPKFRATLFAA